MSFAIARTWVAKARAAPAPREDSIISFISSAETNFFVSIPAVAMPESFVPS